MKRAILFLMLASLPLAAQQQDQPVEKTKKNIVVLTGLPTSQLIPVMAFMSNSLGVTCGHCHTDQWESDEKPAKATARKMIAMTRSINEGSFASKLTVNCNTCHQGHVVPASTPLIDNAGWNRPPSAAPEPLPAASTIMERFLATLADPATVKNRVSTGTVTRFNGRTEPVTKPFALYQEAGGKLEIKTDLPYPPEANAMVGRLFFDAAGIAQRYPEMKTVGRETIRGRDAWVVEAAPGVRFYFDAKTGDLLRRYQEIATPFGPLPARYDLSDYRQIETHRVPFEVQWSRADYQVTHKFATVEENVPQTETGGASRQ